MARDRTPDADEFDRPDLQLAPETHAAQARMAAERGEEYDPYAVERRARDWADRAPAPFADDDSAE